MRNRKFEHKSRVLRDMPPALRESVQIRILDFREVLPDRLAYEEIPREPEGLIIADV